MRHTKLDLGACVRDFIGAMLFVFLFVAALVASGRVF